VARLMADPVAGILVCCARCDPRKRDVPPEPPRRRVAAGGISRTLRAERAATHGAAAALPPHTARLGAARDERRWRARAAWARGAVRPRSRERRRQGGACRERAVAVTRAAVRVPPRCRRCP
jgi:hypothetical protein